MYHKNPLPFIVSILFFNSFVYSEVINVTHLEDFNTLLNNNNAVVVKFFAPWCSLCAATEQPLEELSQLYAGQIPFVQVNIDELPALGDHYAIKYIPTFVLFRQAKPVKRSYRLGVIERTLKHLDSENLGPIEEDDLTSQTILNKVIEFILMPIYLISRVLAKLFGGIMKLFS